MSVREAKPPSPGQTGPAGEPDFAGVVPSPDERFVLSSDQRALALSAAPRYVRLIRRLVSARQGRPREKEVVRDDYERIWAPSVEEWARGRDSRRDLWRIGRRLLLVNGWFIHAAYGGTIAAVAERIGARSVLEVGSGRGINLAYLALGNPELELTGLELTEQGTRRAAELIAAPPPQVMALHPHGAQPPRPESVRLVQASAVEMPFEDGSFDLVFTCLALEQMADVHPRALDEIARVARGWCAFIEPFPDANGPLGRAHLRRVGYFCEPVERLEEHGLEPVLFTAALPQKLTFSAGLAVARVL